jgi:glucuronosyltransferase
MSNIMKDEMIPGKDAAVYWVEHVLRHGAKHLEVSSRKMPFYKQHLLDVWLFLAAILAIMAYLALSFLRCILTCVKKPTKQKTQ